MDKTVTLFSVQFGNTCKQRISWPTHGAIAPLSSIADCAIINALVAETVAILCGRGIEPPVFMSANVDGGDEYNARLLEKKY